ncbi:MAG: AI-2E family transporter [Bacilli bacterium]|jgi:predicted PurR-regulated permease PerM|nr:AI-2E family transporter [Bacilli bacterium]
MNFKRNKEKLDMGEVNEVVSLSKKILHLFYAVMVISIILIVTIIAREWGIIAFLFQVLKVLSPLFIGFIIAWIFNPLVKKMEAKGFPRMVGSMLIYAVILIFLIVFIRILIPTIYNQLNELLANLPDIFQAGEDFVRNFFQNLSANKGLDLSEVQQHMMETMNKFFVEFTTNLPTSVINFIGSFFSSLLTIGFGLIIGLYMLFDFDAINRHLLNLFPKKNRFELSLLLTNISTEVRKSVNGTLLVATMVFVCDSIGFALIGLQAPLLFGFFCGLTDLIPYVGPYIGGAAAVVIGFSQSSLIGVMAIIVALIVQLVENFILQPIVMSKTMKLHPVTIILGLLLFEHFFGIIGMILATPCIALGKVVYKFFVEKYNLFEKDEFLLIDEEK